MAGRQLYANEHRPNESESTPTKCCEIHVDQNGFLKFLLAILTVLCFTLGAFLIILHVHRHVSTDESRTMIDEMEKIKAKYQMLNDTLKELENIKKVLGTTKAGEKVAFSASLSFKEANYGYSNSPLPYKRIFTNVGNAYDSIRGIFTAPVKGVYFFTFSTFGHSKDTRIAVSLIKGGHLMVSSFEHISADESDTGGNSAILELEAGEQVYINIWEEADLYDNENGHNSFSGFLLFPL